ncbi:MAG: hypothetical protein IJN17_00960 [Clostridia bacterium]|nr:hypothetical protein [Clostridia bacterium]
MKRNIFTYLYNLAKIGLCIWRDLADNKKCDIELCLKSSFSTNTSCLELANSMLVTPIDRDDIVTLSLSLHRFNVYSAELFSYKNKFFAERNIKKHTTPISDIFQRTCNAFENGFPSSLDGLICILPNLPEDDYQNHFSAVGLIAEHTLFEKIKKCYDYAVEIHDKIIYAVIKNN